MDIEPGAGNIAQAPLMDNPAPVAGPAKLGGDTAKKIESGLQWQRCRRRKSTLIKKWLFFALFSFALLAAGYIALPRYTIGQLEQAARNENTEQLQRHIDFPALRDNLKLRLQRQLRESVGDEMPEEFGELLSAGANLFIGPLLQQLVTPEGIGELLRGGEELREFERELYRQSSPPPRQPPAVESEEEGAEAGWQLQRWRFAGANRVTADYGEGGAAELRLILERRGLHWQLVDIQLLSLKSETGNEE